MKINNRKEIYWPIFLFILTVLTRIPFTSKFLYLWDSVQFALALEKYDITVHQPHPPGYFLYIMLGRFVNLIIQDANTSFIFISIIFSGLAIVTIYFLGKEFCNQKTGIIAALIALTSPNLWFHGGVALTYVVEAFFSSLIALFCWRILKGEHKYIWISVIALGIAGGIRQNTLVFLFPLWLFSLRGVPLKKIITSLGLLAVICLLWFIPMVWMTGGWDAYLRAFREYRMFVIGHFSVFEKGWASFNIYMGSLLKHLRYGLGIGIFILGLAVYSLLRSKRLKTLQRIKILFFSLWMFPAIFFYLFVLYHPSSYGYVLILLPPFFLLIAESITHINEDMKRLLKMDFSLMFASAIISTNIYLFLFSNYHTSYPQIQFHDHNVSIMLEHMQEFSSSNTAIFASSDIYFGYRHIMYYLPEYWVYLVDVKVGPTGERMETFWGIQRETCRANIIPLPDDINNFVVPIFMDMTDKVSIIKGITINKLSPIMLIASGPLNLAGDISPDLKLYIKRCPNFIDRNRFCLIYREK